MPQELPATEEILSDAQGPRVSAVLIAFNQAPALRRAIEALEHSNERERLEILVVDCGSRDESARIDTEYPSINMLRLPHHLGAARAMNIATRTAKAESIFFLSPDVEVFPDTVPRLAAKLEEEIDAAAVCPLLVDPDAHPVSKIYRLPTREALASGVLVPMDLDLDVTGASIPIEYPGIDALMVRKQFLRGMNFFDQRFGHYWADADLAIKIKQGGKKIRLYSDIRATLYPVTDPLEGDDLAEADKILGAGALVGKYYGFFAGLSFRARAIFKALTHFELGRIPKLVSGQKLDGSQAG